MFFQLCYRRQEKFFCNCWDNCLCPIGGKTGFFGVIEIALFFSSVMSVVSLEKLSMLGLEGSVAIVESLFLNGETLSSDKKLASLDLGLWGAVGFFDKGGRFFDKTCFDKGEKSR